jgi:hypothetical protein
MKQNELLLLSVTIFLTIIAWVAADLYGIYKSTPTNQQIESISLKYSIDTKVLETLKAKKP